MARIDERFDEARRAVARLAALSDPEEPTAAGSFDPEDMASDARLLRFAVAFEAVWFAARQLMQDRYGPIQGTADGTVRACGDVGLLSPDQVARLRATSVFHSDLMGRCRREGPTAPAAEIRAHAEAVIGWLAAIEGAAVPRSGPESVS